MEDYSETSAKLAVDHVDWFLKTLRPLLIDHMIHGFKHGVEFATTKEKGTNESTTTDNIRNAKEV